MISAIAARARRWMLALSFSLVSLMTLVYCSIAFG